MEAGAAPVMIIQELLTGRKFANQLKHRLLPTSDLQDQQHLVAKILHSFKKSISILTRTRRRRTHSSKKKRWEESWTREHSTPNIDDGHSWRKYGQKTILGYKHHRSYYRCRQKFEEGCKATKHVQEIEDNNNYPGAGAAKYKTTYLGEHCCSRRSNYKYDQQQQQLQLDQYYSDLADSSSSKTMLIPPHDHPQHQGQTSFFSSSSVTQPGGANSSAIDVHVHDHHHLLTAAISDPVRYDQQVDEFDILGFPF